MNSEASSETDPEWDRPEKGNEFSAIDDIGSVTGVGGNTQKGVLLVAIVLGVLLSSASNVGGSGLALALCASILLAGKVVAEAIDRIGG